MTNLNILEKKDAKLLYKDLINIKKERNRRKEDKFKSVCQQHERMYKLITSDIYDENTDVFTLQDYVLKEYSVPSDLKNDSHKLRKDRNNYEHHDIIPEGDYYKNSFKTMINCIFYFSGQKIPQELLDFTGIKEDELYVNKTTVKRKNTTISKHVPKKPTAKRNVSNKIKKMEYPSDVTYRNLFDAHAMGKIPFDQGCIVSSFFSDSSYYSKYEIVSYAAVKQIFPTAEGLIFVTGGKKLHVLLEPDTYNKKFQEPVSRSDNERIPKRFAELEIITAANQTKIMVAKAPDESYGSFTILKPTGINFSMIFYDTPEMFDALTAFFSDNFNRFRRVPAIDAKKAAELIISILKRYIIIPSHLIDYDIQKNDYQIDYNIQDYIKNFKFQNFQNYENIQTYPVRCPRCGVENRFNFGVKKIRCSNCDKKIKSNSY